jgi:hypothetical protein
MTIGIDPYSAKLFNDVHADQYLHNHEPSASRLHTDNSQQHVQPCEVSNNFRKNGRVSHIDDTFLPIPHLPLTDFVHIADFELSLPHQGETFQ